MKKQQVPKYYTVKHIKTGRIFQAEYDSESAAFYEKGTGREYDITEVTFIRNNSLSAQMKDMQIPISPGFVFTVPEEWTKPYIPDTTNVVFKNGYISQKAREKARKRHKK